jgi:hypothetical protein
VGSDEKVATELRNDMAFAALGSLPGPVEGTSAAFQFPPVPSALVGRDWESEATRFQIQAELAQFRATAAEARVVAAEARCYC